MTWNVRAKQVIDNIHHPDLYRGRFEAAATAKKVLFDYEISVTRLTLTVFAY